MKVLLLGGSGRLGKELQKYLDCVAPSSKGLDITQLQEPIGDYDIIINSVAYTNVIKAEDERERCFKVNVIGTYNLVKAYPNAKFIYISSEYSKNPINFYSWTKKWGEELVKRFSKNYLIIRTSFSVSPFPHEKAFADQYTRGDYLNIITPMIAKEILKDTKGLIYVGTGRKTMYELAKQTRPDIQPNSIYDIKEVKIPKDYV